MGTSVPNRRTERFELPLGLNAPLTHPAWLYSLGLSPEERRGLLAAQRLVDKGEAEWVEISRRREMLEPEDQPR